MLTRDLLRHDLREGRLRPRFVKPDNAPLLALAESLIAIHAQGEGQTLEELAELAAPLVTAYRSPLIAKGLQKLLLDRCQFQEGDPELPAFRLGVFRKAAAHLAQPGLDDLTAYRRVVGEAVGEEPDPLSRRLFADLPVRQPLEGFRPLTPEALLHRYNLALAQGPLLHCAALTLELMGERVPRLRAFLRHLRFLQLLALVESLPGGGCRVTVDGPLNLLQQTQKYGLQLANLLPVVAGMGRWRLRAEVRLPHHRPAVLELDDQSGLVSHFTRLGGYQPEEFALFARQLREEAPQWEVLPDPPLLNLGERELVAPDFSFRQREGKRIVHLELFHRWHRSALLRRLATLEHPRGGTPPPLVLGVDRSLRKLAEVAERLDRSPWFAERGFLYTDFPPVKRVIKVLEGVAAAL